MKYEVGQIIYAVNPCKMEYDGLRKIDGRETLTVGNAYTIEQSFGREFSVIDDESSPHWFDKREFKKYFSFTKPVLQERTKRLEK